MAIEDLAARVAVLEATVSALAAQVRVTADTSEIMQLQHRYVNALMETDWDTTTDCFATDAVVDVFMHPRLDGKGAIESWFKDELAKTHAGKEGDIVCHHVIDVDGDRAKGKWYLYMMYFYPRTGQSLFWVQGVYDMDYVREDGAWKIAVMRWSERIGLPGGGPPTGLW